MSGTGPALFHDLDQLVEAAPRDLGATAWIRVDPDAVAAFRRATWTDGEDGPDLPLLLLLSLTNRFLPELMQVPGASNGVNYGAESVRFGPPARAGERVRARAALVSAAPAGDAVQTTVEITVEVEARDEPACVVRSLSRWMR